MGTPRFRNALRTCLALTALVVLASCAPQTPAAVFDLRINEVESSGGAPGDWIELTNLGPDTARVGGYILRDDDDTHTYVIPGGTTVPAGGFLVIEEAALGFGLGSADSVRLFKPHGTPSGSYSWTAHASTSYGRCPDGTGEFVTTTSVTKGAANDCSTPPVTSVKVNEVESSGGTPGDWVELFNTGAAPVDASGWKLLDNDDTHTPSVLPAGSTIAAGGFLVIEEAALGFGLGSADSVRLFRPDGSSYETYSWTAHASTSYGRCPDGAGELVTTTSVTKGAPNDCSTPVRVNEVESSGGTPGDWVELINNGAAPADVSGWTVLDNDDTHTPSAIPAGTTIPGGGYLVVEEAALGFGLGSADSVRLFDTSGALVDSYSWTAHAGTTYGRCPDGTGTFIATSASTKAAANSCPGGVVTSPWPGDATIATVDPTAVLGGNMSGLAYESSGSAAPGVLWAVKNGPGTLHRLVTDGSAWAPDSGDWAAGKALRYPTGTGDPDAEGVTLAASSSDLFVATERDNTANSASRNSILRFDASQPGTTLTATAEWNLTADLPATGANLGMEAIAWVPDSALVAAGFVDQVTGVVYDPATYPTHGTGLFFVGLEATGGVYAYALDLTGSGYTRVATIATPFVGVMDLDFDRDRGQLWAICDDGCQGRSTILSVNGAGAFVAGTIYDRPTGMPNFNNEGFTLAAAAECSAGTKPVFWADDTNDDGHAIRAGRISCTV